MLVLSRRKHETLLIGEDITVTVLRISEHSVRLGIEAPRNVSIVRDDVSTRHPAPAEACCDLDEPDEGGEG